MNEGKDNDAIEAPETETVRQQEKPVPADEPMDEKDEINRLLDEGYSVKQIIELGFKRRTAYHYAKLRVKPENELASGNDTSAPSSNGRVKHEMIKLGSKDVIPPEAVLDVLHLPQNGDAVEVMAARCPRRRGLPPAGSQVCSAYGFGPGGDSEKPAGYHAGG